MIACVRERVSSTLLVESKKANSAEDKYRDISGDPAAPCASCAQGHLFPNQIFWFEVECYRTKSSFGRSNIAVFHRVARLALSDVVVFHWLKRFDYFFWRAIVSSFFRK